MKQDKTKEFRLEDGSKALFSAANLRAAVAEQKQSLEEQGQKYSLQSLMENLAERLCVSGSAVKHWCAGHHAPSDLEKIDDIAAVLGVDREFLLEKDKRMQNLWGEITEELGREYTPLVMHVWFSDCRLLGFEKNRLILQAPSEFKREILAGRYRDKVKTVASQILCAETDIRIVTRSGL